MAKLYFRYGAMGSGKSIDLLKVAYNYEERNQNVFLITAGIDERYGKGKITTRIGISKEAHTFSDKDNLFELIKNSKEKVDCVLIDEAQFLSRKNVDDLSDVVDFLNIPVICYGLRADFRGELFEGSKWLLTMADKIEEIKTICECGNKATYNMRVVDGRPTTSGNQIFIGGNESYISVCRRCYKEKTKNDEIKTP